MNISRRDFVAAGAACTAAIGLGGAGAFAAQADAVFVRPPGCVSEDDLVSRCTRCQRCVAACPYSIVQPVTLKEGFVSWGTPELNFKTGYCDYCMKCVEVCPTGALTMDAPTADNLGVAKVISDVCVAWDWTGCTVCADKCPVEGAITIDGHGRPVVDETLCDGCGLCENACPSASLRAYDSAALNRGIYVVSRSSAIASVPGAVTAEQYLAGCRTASPDALSKGGVDHE